MSSTYACFEYWGMFISFKSLIFDEFALACIVIVEFYFISLKSMVYTVTFENKSSDSR